MSFCFPFGLGAAAREEIFSRLAPRRTIYWTPSAGAATLFSSCPFLLELRGCPRPRHARLNRSTLRG
ncbi:MAG: hypothetical protein H0W58_11570 [Acidobacteria bacterium]|nr:hypothetical protein [Acidobacteriota bacterium]